MLKLKDRQASQESKQERQGKSGSTPESLEIHGSRNPDLCSLQVQFNLKPLAISLIYRKSSSGSIRGPASSQKRVQRLK